MHEFSTKHTRTSKQKEDNSKMRSIIPSPQKIDFPSSKPGLDGAKRLVSRLRYRSQFLETIRLEDLQDILERAGTEAVRLKAADLIREMEEVEEAEAMGGWSAS